MKSEKVKILLDTDVVIHFIKGGCLSLLPDILPAYQFAILDIVLDRELSFNHGFIVSGLPSKSDDRTGVRSVYRRCIAARQ